MISLSYFIHIVVVSFTLIVFTNSAIPNYIHLCKRSDPQLEQCINNSITVLKPKLADGIPELEVPGLEPLILDNIILPSLTNDKEVGTVLTNLTVWGPTTFIIEDLRANIEKNIYRFRVLIPSLRINGNYQTNTRVLFLNLKGDGPININVTNYRFDGKLKGNKIQINGEEHLEFEPMKLTIYAGQTHIRLENLFNGNPTLGRATNDAINDNTDVFLDEIKPILQKSLSEKFTNIANKITLKFQYKDLFP